MYLDACLKRGTSVSVVAAIRLTLRRLPFELEITDDHPGHSDLGIVSLA